MYFRRETKINHFDCDGNNALKLSAAMRYMQQTSSEHLEYLGIPPSKLLTENMVFLLTKMCVKIHKMPLCSQTVWVGTAPISTQGVRFVREFVFDSTDGERLISALTLWILADPASHKVLRPARFPYPLPFQQSLVEGIVGDITIPQLPQKTVSHSQIRIQYSHLDVNNHVNNSVYGDFVCDALPYRQLIDRGLDTVAIHFQREARWGELVNISTGTLGADEHFILGSNGENSCFEALVKLR